MYRVREAAQKGQALFGKYRYLADLEPDGRSKGGIHVTDPTNASRTLLMDRFSRWDTEILRIMGIPVAMLPKILPSAYIWLCEAFGGIPIAGDLGDQQAALFGQTCFSPGEAKNTYGTGCFMLLNTGEQSSQVKAVC